MGFENIEFENKESTKETMKNPDCDQKETGKKLYKKPYKMGDLKKFLASALVDEMNNGYTTPSEISKFRGIEHDNPDDSTADTNGTTAEKIDANSIDALVLTCNFLQPTDSNGANATECSLTTEATDYLQQSGRSGHYLQWTYNLQWTGRSELYLLQTGHLKIYLQAGCSELHLRQTGHSEIYLQWTGCSEHYLRTEFPLTSSSEFKQTDGSEFQQTDISELCFQQTKQLKTCCQTTRTCNIHLTNTEATHIFCLTHGHI